jgi:hypothetical protein
MEVVIALSSAPVDTRPSLRLTAPDGGASLADVLAVTIVVPTLHLSA